MAESSESVLWKQIWAPAYIWESLVRVRQFCLDTIASFFCPNVRSVSSEMFSPEDPRSGNCMFCRLNRPHDCLFFEPKFAAIINHIIEAFGKTKLGSNAYVNADLIEQVIHRLPALYEQIGHPTNNGFVWRCVQEKLHLMFPGGVLMMEDIQGFSQNEYVDAELYQRRKYYASIETHRHVNKAEAVIGVKDVTDPSKDPEMDPQIMCGCKFYYEGSCSVYDNYIESKSLCLSSSALHAYKNRKMNHDDYLKQVQIEVLADCELSPVCAPFRIHMFLGLLQHNRLLKDAAIKAKVVALRKESVTKYKFKGKQLL
jgi:hypothetical protein